MEQTKSPFASLTILASLIVSLAGVFGFVVEMQDAVAFLELVDNMIVSFAGMVAIYGRVRASQRIELQ